jgi:hypothetical protein
LFLLVFFFVAGIFLIVNQSSTLPAAISASQGRGQHGTATATDIWCGSDNAGNCISSGDYVSDDGSTTFHDVDFQGHGWPMGKPVAALNEGQPGTGRPLIFRAEEKRPWIWEGILMLFGCAFVVGAPVLAILDLRGVIK